MVMLKTERVLVTKRWASLEEEGEGEAGIVPAITKWSA
jgi:hypothetical protein